MLWVQALVGRLHCFGSAVAVPAITPRLRRAEPRAVMDEFSASVYQSAWFVRRMADTSEQMHDRVQHRVGERAQLDEATGLARA